jgi:hypothetical protein
VKPVLYSCCDILSGKNNFFYPLLQNNPPAGKPANSIVPDDSSVMARLEQLIIYRKAGVGNPQRVFAIAILFPQCESWSSGQRSCIHSISRAIVPDFQICVAGIFFTCNFNETPFS